MLISSPACRPTACANGRQPPVMSARTWEPWRQEETAHKNWGGDREHGRRMWLGNRTVPSFARGYSCVRYPGGASKGVRLLPAAQNGLCLSPPGTSACHGSAAPHLLLACDGAGPLLAVLCLQCVCSRILDHSVPELGWQHKAAALKAGDRDDLQGPACIDGLLLERTLQPGRSCTWGCRASV
jgi:hypothetical protein